MAVGEARPGYELWRPNREKTESQTTRFLTVLLMIVSAILMLIVTVGGWSVLVGGSTYGIIALVFVAVYLLLAVMTWRWSRGALSLTLALSVLLAIFCAVGAGSWFARDKAGFAEPALPADLIGLLVIILIPTQVALLIAAAIAFNQEWHVEEERPIGSGDTGDSNPQVEPGSLAGAS
ncbi:MAG: hypothetical protein KDB48_09325 [Solirubrobacterales bacterium]|nr:hypothetical protein [Solirubrobacterales bacterium]HMT06177.1 hypothetical protein [Solirubrobacterales bacterium]